MWAVLAAIVNWITGWRDSAARKQGEDEFKPTIEAAKERNKIDDQVDRRSDASVDGGLSKWDRDQ